MIEFALAHPWLFVLVVLICFNATCETLKVLTRGWPPPNSYEYERDDGENREPMIQPVRFRE